MNIKQMKIMRVFVAVIAVCVIGLYTWISYNADYCTDEIPDTSSVFVYTVDECIDRLNRTYINGKKADIKNPDKLIEYDDIPEISKYDGVTALYIWDDAVVSEAFGLLTQQEADDSQSTESQPVQSITVAVPVEVMMYYGNPAGTNYMFGLDPSTMPFKGQEYAYIECTKDSCAWAANPATGTEAADAEDDQVYMFFYKYDEATWLDFNIRLRKYLVDYDAISDVSMLVTTSEDGVKLQDELLTRYPSSNYISREFARVFKYETNKRWWVKLALVITLILAVTVITEVILTATAKKSHDVLI